MRRTLSWNVGRPTSSESGGTAMKRKGIPSGLIRYPGGKAKLLKIINSRLQQMFADLGTDTEYREPFLGGGAVGLSLLAENQGIRRAWPNERLLPGRHGSASIDFKHLGHTQVPARTSRSDEIGGPSDFVQRVGHTGRGTDDEPSMSLQR